QVTITLVLISLLFLNIQPITAGPTSNTGSFPNFFDTCTQTIDNGGSIQEAIDAAETGDVICVGTGSFTGPIQISTPGLYLRAADGAVPVINGGANGIVITEADNTTIHGLQIADANNDGIRVENSTGVVIRGNNMTNNGKAVSAFRSPGLLVTENEIFEQRRASRQGLGVEITESDSVQIEQNTISGNPSDGLQLLTSHHASIQNNEISANLGSAIYLLESDSGTVGENMITEGRHHGIHLEESVGNVIGNNTISGSTNIRHGILLEGFSHHTSLLANTISGHDVDIYMVESAFATINDNVMEKGIVIDPDNIRSDFEAGQTHYNHTMVNNTVNGGPLFYGKAMPNNDIPENAQQVIIHNSDGITLDAMTFSDVAIGLQISYSDDVTVTNIMAENNILAGVRLVVSERASISDSEFNNNGTDGLNFESSHFASVTNSSATGNGQNGMVFFWSENSTFNGNTATGNADNGIYIWNSHDGIASNNTATENGNGVVVSRSGRGVAHNNTTNDNLGTGLSVGNVRSPQVTGNTALRNGLHGISTGNLDGTGSIAGNIATHNNYNGLQIGTRHLVTTNITYENNTVSQNGRHGVAFSTSSDVTLTGNTIGENGEYGIYIDRFTDNATISANTISDNGLFGIYMENQLTDFTTVEGNTITGHQTDIYMDEIRRQQNIHDNVFGTGILIAGETSDNFDHFMSGNTVNGKTLFYSRQDSIPEIPADPGQIIIFNGGYVEIDGFDFENVAAGVQVGFSDTLIIRNTTFSELQTGLNATGTEQVTIEDNTFSGNAVGVILQGDHAPGVFENNGFFANSVGLDADNLSPDADARNNWWGSVSGPSGGEEDPETETIADGSGDAIVGSVRFDPWLGQTTNLSHDGMGPDGEGLPVAFELGQNYPNPFNPSTLIAYSVPETAHIRISVYDLIGRKIAVLVDQVREPGRYQVGFDASALSSGVYLYHIDAGSHAITRKMTLVK
ncbi:MAG: right-handed parallel beta-helix repeat-containing protein, partial [Rhodothermaceae bacterium]|nr:right-handed parallel beta-helix repeat-containing protein [Rhodothermaceae bacterium]